MVFNLELLDVSSEGGDCVLVLNLPLLSDLFLADQRCVGPLLVSFVPLFGFEECILEMGKLYVALIINFVDSTVEYDLEPTVLAERLLPLISELVNKLAQPLVIVEVSLVVSHI